MSVIACHVLLIRPDTPWAILPDSGCLLSETGSRFPKTVPSRNRALFFGFPSRYCMVNGPKIDVEKRQRGLHSESDARLNTKNVERVVNAMRY
jgi:hypothetical protein